MRKATRFDLPVNQPLPYSLFDRDGHLLLRKGFVISMDSYVDRVVNRGAFIREVEYSAYAEERKQQVIVQASRVASKPWDAGVMVITAPPPKRTFNQDGLRIIKAQVLKESVFHRYEAFQVALRKLQRAFVHGVVGGFLEQVSTMAAAMIEAAEDDLGELLAASHLARDPRDYRVNHQLLGAIVAYCIGAKMEIDKALMTSLVSAALTRDLGLLEVDASVDRASFPKEKEQNHTLKAVMFLEASGCTDKHWLETVRDHHERLNGSGYPCALTDNRLSDLARVMGVADTYAAMVIPGGKTDVSVPGNVMRQLFTEKECYDHVVTMILYKSMTLYPPGSWVKLENSEIGVVKDILNKQNDVVCVLYDADGMPRLNAIKRRTSDEGCKITSAVIPDSFKSAAMLAKTLWPRG